MRRPGRPLLRRGPAGPPAGNPIPASGTGSAAERRAGNPPAGVLPSGPSAAGPSAAGPSAALLLALVLLLLPAAAPPLGAETLTSVKLTTLGAVTGGIGEDPLVTGYGSGRLSVQSRGSRDVKGLLALDAYAGATSYVDVYRAWIQTDFPALRLTTGKARFTWGEGIYFNAGDVLYGSADLSASLADSVFRDQARLTQAVYLPFGLFSYVEALVMPPEYNFLAALADPSDPAAGGDLRLWKSDGGARVVSQIGFTKVEAGYLYRGSDGTHRPFLSLQGNLLADWYLAASTALGSSDPESDLKENLRISGGLFYLKSFPSDATLTFRLEALAAPWGYWTPRSAAVIIDADTTVYTDPGYGLFLYPEITLAPSSALAFTLNGLVSPVDGSGQVSFSAGWNVFQGLKLLGTASLQTGDTEDIYSLSHSGGWTLVLGAEYIF